jgi:hypothetical protein
MPLSPGGKTSFFSRRDSAEARIPQKEQRNKEARRVFMVTGDKG